MMRTTTYIFLGLFLASSLAHGQVITATLDDSDFIVISGEAVPLLGLDFESPAGLLVPIPGDQSDPFGFLLENMPTQVTFGSLTEPVVVDGDLTLGVQYTGDINGDDLVGSWGGPEFDGAISFPTAPPEPSPPVGGGGTDVDPPPVTTPPVTTPPVTTPPVTNPVVPEPSAGLMLLIGLFSAGVIRSSRRKA